MINTDEINPHSIYTNKTALKPPEEILGQIIWRRLQYSEQVKLNLIGMMPELIMRLADLLVTAKCDVIRHKIGIASEPPKADYMMIGRPANFSEALPWT